MAEFARHERDRLYETYVRPLEHEHWGKFVAVTGQGELFIGPNELDVMRQSGVAQGSPKMIFRIGPRVAGKIR